MVRTPERYSRALLITLSLFLGSLLAPLSNAQALYAPVSGAASDGTANTAPNAAPNADQGAQSFINSGNPNLFTTIGPPLCDTTTGKCSPSGIIPLGIESFNIMILGSGNPNGAGSGTSSLYYPGAIGAVTNATSMALANPPVNTREYIADAIQNLRMPFVTPAYAQGIGFSSLSPLLTLWKLFRDLAYFFFVIIFLVVGFMIMFRSKIGSQTAVTVQQALPKLVISLILVTFSYAIAGLVLDAMYLLIFLMIGVFSQYFKDGQIISGNGTFTLTDLAFNNNFAANMLGLLTSGAVNNVAKTITTIGLGVFNIDPKDPSIVVQALQGISNILITLVLAVVVLVSMFRVFLALIQAYVGIFFSVITAPLQLMIGALPGQNTFGKWFKGLVENVLVFPTLILLFFIAYLFSQGAQGQFTSDQPGFSAPQLGTNRTPGGFAAYQGLIALGVILAMPEVLKVTKGLMKGELGVSVDDLRKNLSKGYGAGRLGAGAMAGVAGVPIGAGVGGLVGALKAKPGEDRLAAARKGAATGAVAGGVIGAGAPTVGPAFVKQVKKSVGGAVTAYGQAAVGGILEERERQREIREEEERKRRGAVSDNVPI